MIKYLCLIIFAYSLEIKEIDFKIKKVLSFDVPTDGSLEYATLMTKLGLPLKESTYVVKDGRDGNTLLIYSTYKKNGTFYNKSTILRPISDDESNHFGAGFDCAIRIDDLHDFHYFIPSIMFKIQTIDGLTLIGRSTCMDEIDMYKISLMSFHEKNFVLDNEVFFNLVDSVILDIDKKGPIYKLIEKSILLYFEKDYDLIKRLFMELRKLKGRASEYQEVDYIIENIINSTEYNGLIEGAFDDFLKECTVKRMCLYDIINILRSARNPDEKFKLFCLADIPRCVRGTLGVYITGEIKNDLGIIQSVSVIRDDGVSMNIESVSIVSDEVGILLLTSELSKDDIKSVKIFIRGVEKSYESRKIGIEELFNN